jgi:hypothetical protein
VVKRTPLKAQSEKQRKKEELLRSMFLNCVLPRDKYKCVRCSKYGERLDPAHYLSRNVAPDLFLDPDNLCSLCRSCHGLTEEHRVPDYNCFKPLRHEWEERRDKGLLPHQQKDSQ